MLDFQVEHGLVGEDILTRKLLRNGHGADEAQELWSLELV
jgi:hypothetical protein